jgi:hypothetical protein
MGQEGHTSGGGAVVTAHYHWTRWAGPIEHRGVNPRALVRATEMTVARVCNNGRAEKYKSSICVVYMSYFH